MRLFRRKEEGEVLATIYYASDPHGSERCWRKFLGAPGFYGAQHAIMGGDLTGKAVVPVERTAVGGYVATFMHERHEARDEAELAPLLEAVRFNGMYPWFGTGDEIEAAREDAGVRDELFQETMLEELARWVALADERSDGGATFYVIAGNDDPLQVDAVLATGTSMVFCDERIVRVGPFEMASCSYANPTPWDSPRELPEDELYARLSKLIDKLEDPGSAIFNFHVPPHGSGLDTARILNPDLTPVFEGGAPVTGPVGSTAVRELIEEHQPLLGLHGHIHESRGEARIGRTLVVNPGSEYNTGRIHGAVVRLGADRVISSQLVVG